MDQRFRNQTSGTLVGTAKLSDRENAWRYARSRLKADNLFGADERT